jgi:glycerophosphoryl diester phosphodiesterase
MQIFAHRGASGTHPENTMASFKEAMVLGADGIETDVHLTKDGILVITHDEEVSQVSTGSGWIKDMIYEELKKLDGGSFEEEAFQGETMPILTDLLELLEPTAMLLNIEIKRGFALYPGIEEKLLETVQERGFMDRTIFSSFNHYSLVKLKALDPAVKIAPLYLEGIYKPYEYAAGLHAYAIHPEKILVDEYIVKEAHKRNLKVHPFTVNDPNMALTFQNLGVDMIITDFPGLMLEKLRS